jgi:hypothetical protein
VLSIDPVPVFVHYALAGLFLGSHLAQLQASGTLSPGQARQWWEYLQHADKYGTLPFRMGIDLAADPETSTESKKKWHAAQAFLSAGGVARGRGTARPGRRLRRSGCRRGL